MRGRPGGSRAARRHRGENRPLGGDVLEHLPRNHAGAATARLGEDQQQRLRVALQLERAAARYEGNHLDTIGPVNDVSEMSYSSLSWVEPVGNDPLRDM